MFASSARRVVVALGAALVCPSTALAQGSSSPLWPRETMAPPTAPAAPPSVPPSASVPVDEPPAAPPSVAPPAPARADPSPAAPPADTPPVSARGDAGPSGSAPALVPSELPPPVVPPPPATVPVPAIAAPPATSFLSLPAVVERPLGYEPFWPWVLPPDGVTPGGYVQGQYENHQDSQDQLNQGALLNRDRFLLRRARASAVGDWTYAAVALELDANTTNGPQVDLRKGEVSLQYRPDRRKPPVLMATVGQFDTPFGYELVESPRTRWFMERSALSQALWPGEPDLGLRLAGALGFFRWTIAALNGEPLGEKTSWSLQDPNAGKEVVFRFGFDALPRDDWHVAGGISALRGKGFHAGTPATKSGLQWNDSNGDGVIQPYELTPISPQAATPSQNFDRWAVGADIRLHHRWGLGVLKVVGEFVIASNLDRGLFVADPVAASIDQRELGFYVGAVQEITRYAVVGLRFDYYDPNSNAFDRRQGRLLPLSQTIRTYSPLVGFVLPDRARLLLQYDVINDALARDVTGVPMDLKNNVWTLRLQVQL